MGYLTATEFAAALGLHRRTVIRWAVEGRVAAHKTPGGHWRIDEDQLDERVMTTSEVARLVGVCQRTVLRWIEAGKIEAEGGGKEPWLVPMSEVRRVGPRARRGL
jgi:excisionase family DNA binding protein